MVQRLYVHNFRCLENFELKLGKLASTLLIGKNGSGKSTVGSALEILQKIARGTNRVKDLIRPADLARGRSEVPIRFELTAELGPNLYEYEIAWELPNGFKEMRVLEEKLLVRGQPVYSRDLAQVNLSRTGPEHDRAKFSIDWHLVALPIVQENPQRGHLAIFREWLARTLILRPTPNMMTGESDHETLEPDPEMTDIGAWFTGLLADTPAVYDDIKSHLRVLMPDFQQINNIRSLAKDSRSLSLQFSSDQANLAVPFRDLSDGEKCFIVSALVLAANRARGPVLCFWDEPDSHLALDEVGHFVMGLRQAFQSGGQLIATSHSSEAIRRFSDENTLLLSRRNHLEPTTVRALKELKIEGDLVGALARGDVETWR